MRCGRPCLSYCCYDSAVLEHRAREWPRGQLSRVLYVYILNAFTQVLEEEKQRNLKKIQHETSTPHKHAPGWNEYLASASEAAVKVCSPCTVEGIVWLLFLQADKSETSFHELQTETVEHVKKRHSKRDSVKPDPDQVPPTPKGAISGEERVDAYEATYERDETSGPLKAKT